MTRFGYAMATCLSLLGIGIAAFVPVAPRLLWNASASVPVGLYALHPGALPDTGDLVAAMPPEPLARFMAERRYLPPGTPLLKHVAALPGQEVCRTGRAITVDRVPFGDALDHDSHGRPLPVWRGCRRLGAADVFLMNPSVADSFDGRYVGPLPAATVIGTATPLWTDEDGDGRFVWRAPTR